MNGGPNKAGQLDLINGPIAPALLSFALPTLGSNILQSLNGSINAIWVGRLLGENELAATSNANLILFLMLAALIGFGLASTIMISQNHGRRDIDAVRRIVGTGMGLFLALSLVIGVLGYIEAPTLLNWLNTPAEAKIAANTYLRVIFLAMPAMFLVTLLTMSLRGVGDSITPLIWMVVSVLLDIALNPILMLGIGPIAPMGIAGAATATLIASYFSLFGLLSHIYLRDHPIRLRGKELRYLLPNLTLVKPVLAKGIPMTIQMFVLAGSALAMIGLINKEGVDTTAAYGAVSQLWNYVSMPAMAIGAAVSAMAAQNIGANRWDRVDGITRWGLIFTVGITIVMIAILMTIDRWTLGLFLGGDSPVVPIAQHIQRIATWNLVMFAVSFVLVGVVRANGSVWPAVIILFITMIPVRLIVAAVAKDTFGSDALWWSFPISSLCTMILTVLYYRYGKWRNARLLASNHPIEPLPPVG